MEIQILRRPTDVALPDGDPTRRLVAGWLLAQLSDSTREAYQRDIEIWLAHLAAHDVHPLAAIRGHADAWARLMARTPGRGGKPPSPATINRRIASVSSFYDYCVSDDAIDVNRIRAVKRHRIDKDFSPTFRPTADQAQAIMRVAHDDGPRSTALVILLIFSGARVSEALGAEWEDISTDGEQPVLEVVRKGGTKAYLPFKPPELVGGALDAYREHRARRAHVEPHGITGPIFMDRNGRPLTRQAAANLIASIGRRAGCPRLSPHSLRHAFASLSKEAGASKDDIQKWMGHQDGRTTQRYLDRVRGYDSHPGQKIAALLGIGQ
jgi:site-specific recombinase XerD